MSEKIKTALIAVGVVAFFGIGIYQMFFRVTDEIGFLGGGKVGRQVFIQTLDHITGDAISVESEFYDHSFLSRMILGEPVRTTLRLDFHDNGLFTPTEEGARQFLDQPHRDITDQYEGAITMQEDFELKSSRLREMMQEKGVVTVEDFLTGLGFRYFEVFVDGTLVSRIELQDVRNVYHVGG